MSLDLLIDFRPFEIEMQGQKINMELRPLTNEHMIILSELFDDIDTIKVKKSKQLTSAETIALYKKHLSYQKYADPVFKDHVRNIEGLTINGKEPTYRQFATEPALCNITISILTELIVISGLSVTEIKN